jgi:hypothetical protein
MEGPVSEGAQMTPAYVRGLESRIVELLGRIEQLEVFLGEAVAYIENPAAYHSSGEQVARGCRQILEKTNAWA